MIADPFLDRHLLDGGSGPRCDYCNLCVARGGRYGVDCYNPGLRPERQRMLRDAGFTNRTPADSL